MERIYLYIYILKHICSQSLKQKVFNIGGFLNFVLNTDSFCDLISALKCNPTEFVKHLKTASVVVDIYLIDKYSKCLWYDYVLRSRFMVKWLYGWHSSYMSNQLICDVSGQEFIWFGVSVVSDFELLRNEGQILPDPDFSDFALHTYIWISISIYVRICPLTLILEMICLCDWNDKVRLSYS